MSQLGARPRRPSSSSFLARRAFRTHHDVLTRVAPIATVRPTSSGIVCIDAERAHGLVAVVGSSRKPVSRRAIARMTPSGMPVVLAASAKYGSR